VRRTVDRFIERFGHIESSLKKRGQSFSQTSLEEMERLWQEAKK